MTEYGNYPYPKPSMMPRRSERNLGKLVDYTTDLISLYPDGPPIHDVEITIHDLNMQGFSSSSYARVDDILVYALFATKHRAHCYKALLPATASEQRSVTDKEALSIANIVRQKISHSNPSKAECDLAALEISQSHQELLEEGDLPIIEQYVNSWGQ